MHTSSVLMIIEAPVVPTLRSRSRSPNSRPNDGSIERVANCNKTNMSCVELWAPDYQFPALLSAQPPIRCTTEREREREIILLRSIRAFVVVLVFMLICYFTIRLANRNKEATNYFDYVIIGSALFFFLLCFVFLVFA